MSLILAAARFAKEAHGGQSRKFNGLPYITHPARVAGRVAIHDIASEETVAAAFLHDVMEDCGTQRTTLEDLFGDEIAKLVSELTNPSKGSPLPRGKRKKIDRDHLRTVSREAKIIKLIDRIDNLQEMHGAPNDFIEIYTAESQLLKGAIGDADPKLSQELSDAIDNIVNAS